MTRSRIVSLVVGVVSFGFAHGLITGAWLRATLAPNPLIRPWFTNSGRSVLFTAAVVAAAAFATALGSTDRRGAMERGITVGVGALIAMVAVLTSMGMGTLGPIVLLIGGVILMASGTAGGSIAAAFKRG